MLRKIALTSIALMFILATTLSGCGTKNAKYTLNIAVVGEGTVTPNSGTTYQAGTVVELKPTSAQGYDFDHWGGPDGALVKANRILMDGNKAIIAHFVPVLKGRVRGALTLDPLIGVTVSFSDGGTAVTDAGGYWVKKYDPASPPASPVTVAPVADGVTCVWETITPSTVTVSWPAEEIIFGLEGYRFTDMWGSYGTGDGQFNSPYYVAVDQAGDIYVTDTENHRIKKFTSAGVYLAKWGSWGSDVGKFKRPCGIAVDANGNIYVVDKDNQRVQKFDGTSWSHFAGKTDGTTGTGNGEFNNPRGIAVDDTGDIYVADYDNNSIQKFDSTGNFKARWGTYGQGDGQFYFPAGVAADPYGNIYVADSSNNRIQKLNSAGVFQAKWGSQGSADGQFGQPSAIAADANGNIYVADTYNWRVQKFSSGGSFLAKWGSQGSGDGQFETPWGIAVDANGDLYIADTYNHRIQKFEYLY